MSRLAEVATGAGSIAELRRHVAGFLAASSPSAALDARLLVAHALGCAPNDLSRRDDEAVGDAIRQTVMAMAMRRRVGEPVARIVGTKEFYGLSLTLGPDTLIPRPDTEALVDAVLAVADRDRALSILDLGTGSGAILLALLSELPKAHGLGIDLSGGALTVAAANAERLGLAERVRFAVGDWTVGVDERFDLVVANPPYVATAEIADLQVEVRDHDPHLALDGGAEGLDAHRAIVPDLDRVLAGHGAAFLEIGAGQADAIAALARSNQFVAIFRQDLSGIDRVAILIRHSE